MKTILLTGATDGIGFETAKKLVLQGHRLLIHGRSQSKLDKVKTELDELGDQQLDVQQPGVQQLSSPERVETYRADLSNFDEVKSMLAELKNQHELIDVIINNAGIFKVAKPHTSDGLDVRFVVNTFAPYLIVKNLIPILADDGRIINLSSAAQAPVNLKALSGKQAINDDFQAYAQSKLAITIWSQGLAKALKRENPNNKQVIISVNPGSLLASKMVKEGFGVAGNDLGIGANVLVDACLSKEFSSASGRYFDNDHKCFSKPHQDALDADKCSAIMEMIEDSIARYS